VCRGHETVLGPPEKKGVGIGEDNIVLGPRLKGNIVSIGRRISRNTYFVLGEIHLKSIGLDSL
jgi:hypothetical protein